MLQLGNAGSPACSIGASVVPATVMPDSTGIHAAYSSPLDRVQAPLLHQAGHTMQSIRPATWRVLPVQSSMIPGGLATPSRHR